MYAYATGWDYDIQYTYGLSSNGSVSRSEGPMWSGQRGYASKTFNSAPSAASVSAPYNTALSTVKSDVVTAGDATHTYDETLAFENLQGKIILDSTGHSYKIDISTQEVTTSSGALSTGSALYGTLNTAIGPLFNAPSQFQSPFDLTKTYTKKKIILRDVEQVANYTYSITGNRDHVIDQPYDMFCMPYGDVKVINTAATPQPADLHTSASLNLITATEMMTKYGIGAANSYIYDVQLVPYCPLPQSMITGDAEITVSAPGQYSTILNSQSVISGYIFNCSQSSFTLDLPLQININNTKLENQCDMYRLVSPNFNGQFEFNAAKNGGVNAINVDCTYIPLATPYIHLNPDFHVLYGADYNDARGLICGGDFSLPAVNSSWNQYQIQNKNFQNIFDREVQNMDVNHKYDMINAKATAAIGTISGAVSGGTAGGMMGGIYGAVAGAAVGGLASGIGGALDVKIKQELYNEALDYKRDMFGYQLDNIKAMPQSLARTTAFTYNNKLFPILEYYTCTDVEKKAVADKIAWNSMTVETTGKIIDYLDNSWSCNINGEEITDKGYIKGKLIRLEGLNDDTHVLNAIADELYKGVYTK